MTVGATPGRNHRQNPSQVSSSGVNTCLPREHGGDHSLGQISHALSDVAGEYRLNM